MIQWRNCSGKRGKSCLKTFGAGKFVEHVKKIEENYWESDRIQDNKVEQLIIKLKPTDSSSSEMESFSESSDSSDSDQP